MIQNALRQSETSFFAHRIVSGLRAAGLLAALLASLVALPAGAAVFNVFGIHGDLNLNATYAYAIRLEEPDDGVINAPPDPDIPIPKAFKYPQGYNFDDGDRNFDQWDAVNNRLTLFSQLSLEVNDHIKFNFSGDAFYDDVYHSRNAHEQYLPNMNNGCQAQHTSLNSCQQPTNSFNSATSYFNGSRARLLDAYVNIFYYIGDTGALNIKLGRQVTAWGQSLFFSGVALAQSPADATKATVPGAKVKSILLPTEQLAVRWRINDTFTLVGQWKFRYKHTELNPDGGFFSPADVVGPGARFAYGIKNPLNPTVLKQLNVGTNLGGVLDVVGQALLGLPPGTLDTPIPLGPLGPILDQTVGSLLGTVSDLGLLDSLLTPSLSPARTPDQAPDKWDFGQWGIGLEYRLNYTTKIGFYHLNYHNTNPSPSFQFGFFPLTKNGAITTQYLAPTIGGIKVPVTYAIKYFQDIKLNAVTFSTVLFGTNFGGEFIYRNGIDVLVDVKEGIAGPVPTATRADVYQVLLNGIKVYGPGPFSLWDSLNVVGSVGYNYVDDVSPRKTHNPAVVPKLYYDKLHFDKQAAAFSLRLHFTKRSVLPGWDFVTQIAAQGAVWNHAAVAGAFGSLLGEGDYRLGVSIAMIHLQKLSLGLHYAGFLGSPNFRDRPLQDRDTLSFTASYQIF